MRENMNKTFFHLLTVGLFFFNFSFSQTFNFKIKKDKGNGQYINVIFKDVQTNKIFEYTRFKFGESKYKTKNIFKNVILEISSTNYKSVNVTLQNINLNEEVLIDEMLFFKDEKIIEEVVVKKSLPFKVKKDTTTFDVKHYTNAGDKKIEDVLKKMPGIEVDDKGVISYKGVKIETINLDGDNILGDNYKIASKNINVEMIDKVEAIENFSLNPLLKGIDKNGKTALNLQFKKNKNQWIGELSNLIGSSFKDKEHYYSNNYIIQLSSKSKSFSTLNLNNIGRTDDSFKYNILKSGIEYIENKDLKSTKLFESKIFSPNIDPLRYNNNCQYYFSYNNLFKLTKKTNLKINLDFLNDKINSIQFNSQLVFSNNANLELKDQNTALNKISIFRFNPEFTYRISNNMNIEFYSNNLFEKEKNSNNFIKNNNLLSNNNVKTSNNFTSNKVSWSIKLDNFNFLQINAYHFLNDTPQYLHNYLDETKNQLSEYNKKLQVYDFLFLGKKNKLNYSFFVIYNRKKVFYKSINNDFINHSNFNNENFNTEINLKYELKKFQFSYNSIFSNYYLKIDEKKNNFFRYQPKIRVEYKNNSNKYYFNYENNISTISDENIFENRIIQTNRIYYSNEPNLDFQKNEKYTFGFIKLNLSNEKSYNFLVSHFVNRSFFMQKLYIDAYFTEIKNVFYNLKKETTNFSFRYSDYIKTLSLRTELVTSFAYNKYPNILNNSDIRNNSNYNCNLSLKLTSGFISKINFQEKVFFDYFKSENESLENKLTTLKNDLLIFVNINSNNKIKVTNNTFIPNLQNYKSYNFLDFEYKYIYKKTEFYFIMNNILNQKFWSTEYNDDYSVSIATTNLINRYALIGFDYNF